MGLALQLCALRYLGFVPRNLSAAPRSAACFVADQLEVSPDEIQSYARREHTTDTAGYTEIVFALFHLLGLQFAPRIRDLGAQRLYRLDAPPRKEGVAVLLKGLVRSKTLLDNWDELLRVAGSLKLGWVTASLLISKLQAGARENVLSRALRDLGRLVKTQFILTRIMQCAVKRRRFSVGAKPTRQLSLQPVAMGGVEEVTNLLKPSV